MAIEVPPILKSEAVAQSFGTQFSRLNSAAKAQFVAWVIHRETIHVRGTIRDDPTDIETLRRSNERVHHLAAYVAENLAGTATKEFEESVISGIADETAGRGKQEFDELNALIARIGGTT